MSHRARAAIELGLAMAAVEVALWFVPSHAADWELAVAVIAACALAWASYRRRRAAGQASPRPRIGPGRAWSEAALATALLIGVAALIFAFFREPYDEVRLFVLDRAPLQLASWLGRRLVFAGVQQVALQLFIAPLCLEIVGGTAGSAALAAALFASAHLPLPALVMLTFVAALVWVALFRRGRRLAPLIATHALLWIAAFTLVPDRLTYDMRVGRAAVEARPVFAMLDGPLGRSILRTVATPGYFARRGGTEDGFVRGLYRDILGRDPAAWEVEFWVRRLQDEPRVEVAKKFVISDELRGILRRYGGRYRFPFRR
jgi:membrane protease YdiL (CAAX protease family)